MKLSVLIILLFTLLSCGKDSIHLAEQVEKKSVNKAFTFVWEFSDDGEIVQFPMGDDQYQYDFKVDWGDGTISEVSSYDDSDQFHKYEFAGEYTVRAIGLIEHISFYQKKERNFLTHVKNLGRTGLVSLFESFYQCFVLKTFVLGKNSDMSKVKTMRGTFHASSQLVHLDLKGFNSKALENLDTTFSGLHRLEHLDLSDFDVSQVKTMTFMFSGMQSLKKLDLSHFDVYSVKDFTAMFNDLSSLEVLNLNNWKFGDELNPSPFGLNRIKYDSPDVKLLCNNEEKKIFGYECD